MASLNVENDNIFCENNWYTMNKAISESALTLEDVVYVI